MSQLFLYIQSHNLLYAQCHNFLYIRCHSFLNILNVTTFYILNVIISYMYIQCHNFLFLDWLKQCITHHNHQRSITLSFKLVITDLNFFSLSSLCVWFHEHVVQQRLDSAGNGGAHPPAEEEGQKGGWRGCERERADDFWQAQHARGLRACA